MISKEILELLDRTTTSAVCDVLMKRGLPNFMRQRIRPLGDKRVAGYALTIERKPIALADPAKPRPAADFMRAIEEAPAGTVLVFNGHPDHEAALWGGLLAAAILRNNLGGVVADGPVRDPGEIVELGCPCFCTGSVSAGQAGILTLGEIGAPLECGGVVVRTGDFVYGDVSGVVVIPAGMEVEVLRAGVDAEARDQAAMKMIRGGKNLTETMKALGRA